MRQSNTKPRPGPSPRPVIRKVRGGFLSGRFFDTALASQLPAPDPELAGPPPR